MDDFSGSSHVRPWGSYTVLDEGEGYQVKRLDVAPGRRLSLQYHMRRQEHWTVVRGTAEVLVFEKGREKGAESLSLGPGEHVFIPREYVHRLGNSGPEPMSLIEVQTGDYLGEDDIIRLDDDFGRTG